MGKVSKDSHAKKQKKNQSQLGNVVEKAITTKRANKLDIRDLDLTEDQKSMLTMTEKKKGAKAWAEKKNILASTAVARIRKQIWKSIAAAIQKYLFFNMVSIIVFNLC